jgi:hypothetical protein
MTTTIPGTPAANHPDSSNTPTLQAQISAPPPEVGRSCLSPKKVGRRPRRAQAPARRRAERGRRDNTRGDSHPFHRVQCVKQTPRFGRPGRCPTHLQSAYLVEGLVDRMVRGSPSLLGRMEKSPASRGFFHTFMVPRGRRASSRAPLVRPRGAGGDGQTWLPALVALSKAGSRRLRANSRRQGKCESGRLN